MAADYDGELGQAFFTGLAYGNDLARIETFSEKKFSVNRSGLMIVYVSSNSALSLEAFQARDFIILFSDVCFSMA